jgi:MraZ protein
MGAAVRHPVLIGEHELTLDDKNRLLVPAEIRRSIPPELGDSFYMVLGINRVPWLYCERYYEDLVMQVPDDMIPGDDSLAFDQMVFGMASKLAWDKQGRILVPERMVKRASLDKDVTLVGVKNHLELWGRAAWETRREELEKRAPEVFARARQSRQSPSAQPTVL